MPYDETFVKLGRVWHKTAAPEPRTKWMSALVPITITPRTAKLSGGGIF